MIYTCQLVRGISLLFPNMGFCDENLSSKVRELPLLLQFGGFLWFTLFKLDGSHFRDEQALAQAHDVGTGIARSLTSSISLVYYLDALKAMKAIRIRTLLQNHLVPFQDVISQLMSPILLSTRALRKRRRQNGPE
jgi:hypothetical protein